jgi:hypothetical protein
MAGLAAPTRILLASVITCLALSACVVAPTPGGLYVGPAVAVEPPPPQTEYYGAPPAVGYIWIGGYWNWAGGRYVWAGGHWEAPHPGYRWEPRRWVRTSGGWRMAGGRWMRR